MVSLVNNTANNTSESRKVTMVTNHNKTRLYWPVAFMFSCHGNLPTSIALSQVSANKPHFTTLIITILEHNIISL